MTQQAVYGSSLRGSAPRDGPPRIVMKDSEGSLKGLGWFTTAVFIAFMLAGIAGDIRPAGRGRSQF